MRECISIFGHFLLPFFRTTSAARSEHFILLIFAVSALKDFLSVLRCHLLSATLTVTVLSHCSLSVFTNQPICTLSVHLAPPTDESVQWQTCWRICLLKRSRQLVDPFILIYPDTHRQMSITARAIQSVSSCDIRSMCSALSVPFSHVLVTQRQSATFLLDFCF